MPLINVQMLGGRSPDQKRALIRALADAVQTTLGVPEEAVRIILNEVARALGRRRPLHGRPAPAGARR